MMEERKGLPVPKPLALISSHPFPHATEQHPPGAHVYVTLRYHGRDDDQRTRIRPGAAAREISPCSALIEPLESPVLRSQQALGPGWGKKRASFDGAE
jgi:hypothetical protein